MVDLNTFCDLKTRHVHCTEVILHRNTDESVTLSEDLQEMRVELKELRKYIQHIEHII